MQSQNLIESLLLPKLQQNFAKFGWPDADLSNLKFKRMSGISNVVWQIEHGDSASDPSNGGVLLKVFNDTNLVNLIDRNIENQVAKAIADSKLGPEVLYCDKTIRIERFIVGETVSAELMQDRSFQRKLMMLIPALHAVKIPALQKKDPFTQMLDNEFALLTEAHKHFAQKSEIYSAWEKDCCQQIMTNIGHEAELQWLLSQVPANSPLKFGHGDMLNGNIMLTKYAGSAGVLFIDFEYGGYNFPWYDLANFINEVCIDYTTEEWPKFTIREDWRASEEELRDLALYYLFGRDLLGTGLLTAEFIDSLTEDRTIVRQKMVQHLGGDERLEKLIDDLVHGIKLGVLMSQWYWVIWSIVSSGNDEIEFGYVEFGWERYKVYQDLKKNYLISQAQLSSSSEIVNTLD
jgi:thiamine kinase-like enzyme